MLSNSQYRFQQTIHFKRWSNKSYAVFCSLGRQIKISNVLRLLDGLKTVKSAHFEFFAIVFRSDVSENQIDDDLLEKLGEEIIPEGVLFPVANFCLGVVDYHQRSILETRTNPIFKSFIQHRPFWAFFGLNEIYQTQLTELNQLQLH